MNLLRRIVILSTLFLTIALPASVPAQTTGNGSDGTVLKEIIIFGRHGIRAPTSAPSTLDQYSANSYPVFEDQGQTGYLTPNGATAARLLGAYFNAYLVSEGLLTGDPQTDLARTYIRANSIQRSNVTADKLGVGLIYGSNPPAKATVPVHSYDLATADKLAVPDPVFDPLLKGVASIDTDDVNFAVTQAQAIFGGGTTPPTALASAYSGELALLSAVLYPPPAQPTNGAQGSPGSLDPTTQPITLTASAKLPPQQPPYFTGNVINMGGLSLMTSANDPFVMQYADGFQIGDGKTFNQNEVAWGLLTPDTLSLQTRLNVLQINIAMRTPLLDRVQSSNAASHVLRTMEQAVTPGATVRGKFGSAKSRVHIIISSDYYVAGLAGLLNVHWLLPGYQPDFVGPGGALVFELRQVQKTGAYVVRVFFTGQTFDQLRNLTPLSLQDPPATLQLMVPDGSDSNLDVKFSTFKKLLTQAIGSQYVQKPSKEDPPGVLTGVPGE